MNNATADLFVNTLAVLATAMPYKGGTYPDAQDFDLRRLRLAYRGD